MSTSVAIMQPYIFPYLGYFQLINAVDDFIFYDDVNYIKGGWINRNRILIGGKPHTFTIPLDRPSSFKLIKDVDLSEKHFNNWKKKFIRTLEQSYKKAPFFKTAFPIVIDCLDDALSISDLVTSSVEKISKYLGINTGFIQSSNEFSEFSSQERETRIISICNKLNASRYINPAGGIELYSKEIFQDNGLSLEFMDCELDSYDQFGAEFVPGLSIIDVMMFNSVPAIQLMLNKYSLI